MSKGHEKPPRSSEGSREDLAQIKKNAKEGFSNGIDLPAVTLSPKVERSIRRKIENRQTKIDALLKEVETLATPDSVRAFFADKTKFPALAKHLEEQATILSTESQGTMPSKPYEEKVLALGQLGLSLLKKNGGPFDAAATIRELKRIMALPSGQKETPPQPPLTQTGSPLESELRQLRDAVIAKERRGLEEKPSAPDSSAFDQILARLEGSDDKLHRVGRASGKEEPISSREVAETIRSMLTLFSQPRFQTQSVNERRARVLGFVRSVATDTRLQSDLRNAFETSGLLPPREQPSHREESAEGTPRTETEEKAPAPNFDDVQTLEDLQKRLRETEGWETGVKNQGYQSPQFRANNAIARLLENRVALLNVRKKLDSPLWEGEAQTLVNSFENPSLREAVRRSLAAKGFVVKPSEIPPAAEQPPIPEPEQEQGPSEEQGPRQEVPQPERRGRQERGPNAGQTLREALAARFAGAQTRQEFLAVLAGLQDDKELPARIGGQPRAIFIGQAYGALVTQFQDFDAQAFSLGPKELLTRVNEIVSSVPEELREPLRRVLHTGLPSERPSSDTAKINERPITPEEVGDLQVGDGVICITEEGIKWETPARINNFARRADGVVVAQLGFPAGSEGRVAYEASDVRTLFHLEALQGFKVGDMVRATYEEWKEMPEYKEPVQIIDFAVMEGQLCARLSTGDYADFRHLVKVENPPEPERIVTNADLEAAGVGPRTTWPPTEVPPPLPPPPRNEAPPAPTEKVDPFDDPTFVAWFTSIEGYAQTGDAAEAEKFFKAFQVKEEVKQAVLALWQEQVLSESGLALSAADLKLVSEQLERMAQTSPEEFVSRHAETVKTFRENPARIAALEVEVRQGGATPERRPPVIISAEQRKLELAKASNHFFFGMGRFTGLLAAVTGREKWVEQAKARTELRGDERYRTFARGVSAGGLAEGLGLSRGGAVEKRLSEISRIYQTAVDANPGSPETIAIALMRAKRDFAGARADVIADVAVKREMSEFLSKKVAESVKRLTTPGAVTKLNDWVKLDEWVVDMMKHQGDPDNLTDYLRGFSVDDLREKITLGVDDALQLTMGEIVARGLERPTEAGRATALFNALDGAFGELLTRGGAGMWDREEVLRRINEWIGEEARRLNRKGADKATAKVKIAYLQSAYTRLRSKYGLLQPTPSPAPSAEVPPPPTPVASPEKVTEIRRFSELEQLSKENLLSVVDAVPNSVWASALQDTTQPFIYTLATKIKEALPLEKQDDFVLEVLAAPLQPQLEIEAAQAQILEKAREILANKTP